MLLQFEHLRNLALGPPFRLGSNQDVQPKTKIYMGLTLFLLYVDKLLNCFRKGRAIAYADDVTLFANGETAEIASWAL